MKIAILHEKRPFERRVAATPDTVKKFVAMGFDVCVEAGAGVAASYTDDAYTNAGATLGKDTKKTLEGANIVLKVQAPMTTKDGGDDELALMPEGATLIGILNPHQTKETIKGYANKKITSFAMELAPRITRAQSMDVLSSQSNLAGYKAVIDAAETFNRAFPMMMTAAGTIAPARVLVFGAGVAGLQAIATAKRMGAVVSAFDVRSATKEQVQSLGGTFVEVESDESGDAVGGYAKEMSDEYKARQAAKIREVLGKSDIAICTALIPGKPAPRLITDDMIQLMKPGSVIVDLAVESGGNCEGSRVGEIVEIHGVKVMGHANMASRLATDASALYARNVLNFMGLIVDPKSEAKALTIDWNDEIIKATALTHEGKVVNETFA